MALGMGREDRDMKDMDRILERGGYAVVVGGEERAQIAARHWGDAASQLYYRIGDDEWEPTPFEVADARHSATDAALLIDAWMEVNFGDGFLADGEEFTLADV